MVGSIEEVEISVTASVVESVVIVVVTAFTDTVVESKDVSDVDSGYLVVMTRERTRGLEVSLRISLDLSPQPTNTMERSTPPTK